ncbi:hypothetical protein N658DRAFT_362142 [Parathielavia hyrcaniae]|uniref:Uncharacterized protein n=1 Tax=Parathielavia hyrcaniae TaxID=113614 RepID=A0AAN6SWY2_9PEZI|nr:hypothetical protein N658DRAFT_362142 [Parathielavia hyrcaniae]
MNPPTPRHRPWSSLQPSHCFSLPGHPPGRLPVVLPSCPPDCPFLLLPKIRPPASKNCEEHASRNFQLASPPRKPVRLNRSRSRDFCLTWETSSRASSATHHIETRHSRKDPS